jgi:hypothetical protein
MISITKNNIDERLSEVRTRLLEMLERDNTAFVDLLTPEQEKTARQNRTFHSLVDCFWKSGCSSFLSKSELRWHYKRLIGLIEVAYFNPQITEETKSMVWQALKVLPLAEGQRALIVDLLKGKVMKEHSWSEAKKERATEAIDALLDDMDDAGVIASSQGKKYEEILGGLGEFRG